MTFATEYFERDIASHQMWVLRDDGVYRHLRFKRPGTMCMHFDLLTWPGYLCYTGDMGTYVFQRLHDMLEFFRRSENRAPYRMDLRYWAEKLQAHDQNDQTREWSGEKFREEVRDFFDQHADEEWSQARRESLWTEIDEHVCSASYEDEHAAWVALRDFEHDGFYFCDWEGDCRVWTHRFLWCCHAIEWAVSTYDAHRAERAVEQ